MMVAGFGFRQAATRHSLADALAMSGYGDAIDAVATLDAKMNHAFRRFAGDRAIITVAPSQAETAHTLTTSTASLNARQISSVAEAVALAAAGPGARLLGPRVVSDDRMATCAIAIGEHR